MSAVPAPAIYAARGGRDAVRALVDRFYDIMEQDPALAPLRAMHAPDLAPMRDKLADWMSAWLGGPQPDFERPDAVCFDAAHRGLAIDVAIRDRWLDCMYRAPAELANFLRNC